MPIEVVGDTGAIILGNSDIPSLLIMQYKSITGFYETSEASTQEDYYKTTLNLKLLKTQMKIKSNVDYKDPLLPDRILKVRSRWSKLKARFFIPEETQRLLFANNWNGLPRYRFDCVTNY